MKKFYNLKINGCSYQKRVDHFEIRCKLLDLVDLCEYSACVWFLSYFLYLNDECAKIGKTKNQI